MKLILRFILVAAIATSSGSVLLVRAQAQGDAQGPALMSQRARNQIRALMQEKASRSHGRRKMDSQLIYSIKMHRGERIAEGVDSLLVKVPRTATGAAIVDITANVGPDFLRRLRQAGAKILGAYPRSRSVRAEIDLNALDTIAEFPEVYHIQPMQEAITGQGTTSQGPGATVDPEHLRTTRPEFEERASSLSAEVALMIEEFQANASNVGIGGVRKSEADLTHRAAAARNTYGSDGTGIKIGVLSDGVRNLAAVQASGDLGPVTVLPGQSGTSPGQCSPTASCDEGTAMLEIVHDIAPGAQLFFATAFGGIGNFADNIRALRAAGCDIIVDDVFYFGESPFQDGQAQGIISPTNGGVIVQAVNDVTAAGALYFSSAGNAGNKSDNTSGVWEGDFVDGGDAPAILGGASAGRVHQFPGGLTYDVVTAVGQGFYILNWSDPLGGSTNDYDLYALNAAGTAVTAASTGSQDGTREQDPSEAIPVAGMVTFANTRLVIVRFSGEARYLRLTTNRGRLSVNTPGQTTGHSTAANAFGVAATPVATPGVAGAPAGPFPDPFTATNQVERFSSDGPRKLFFQADGTPFTPGDLLASGGISRQKPDLTAADGVSVTGAGGFGMQFFGTSAAAPHAAAIAALLKAANPSLTPAMVRDALQNTAIDNEGPGIDRDSGSGIIMADTALQSIGASPTAPNVTLGILTLSDVGGNGNGFLEPGERGTIALPLINTGVAPATGVTATLSSSTPGVTITPSSSRSYPDIAATTGTSSAAPFEFVLQESAVYAAAIDFVMTTTYNGVTRSFPFIVPTGQLANISTVLDTIAPPAAPTGASYTAATGNQTSRMNFTFPISGCGTPKANPGALSSMNARRYDAYTFSNPSASPICVTVLLTHSATALLYVDAYLTAFNPASVATNFAGDNGGSTTSGAGTTQLFSFTVAPGQTFVVVVSESNPNGGLNVPYNLRVSGLPAEAVPANVAPVNAVPGPQNVLEDGALVLSGASAISVSDADAGNNPVEVTVAAAGGVVSLGGTAGLTFTSGTGSGDASMTFTGSIAAVNSALDGTTYAPAANFNGAASITVTTNDNGNTGTGGAMSDTDAVPITVTAVNDAPSFVAGANQTVAEDAGPQTVANWATVSAGPADESGQTLTVLATSDNMALFSVPPAVAPDGTLTFAPAGDANGTATVTLVLMDNGGTSDGGVDTSTATSFTITVTSVNDAPSFTAGASQTVAEDAGPRTVPAWATSISAGPAAESGQTVNFVVTNDNNALFSVQPAVAADGTLTFTAAPDAVGQATVTLVLKDDGGTDGGGADASAAHTFTISVTPVNDAPSFTAGAGQTVAEDAGLQTVPAWAAGITAGPADESGQTLAFIVTSDNPALFSVQPSVAPDGTLTFQPASNVSGQAIVTVALRDDAGTGGGGLDASAATSFTIAVTPVNDAPSFTAGASQTVAEDAGLRTVPGWATSISAGPADDSGQAVNFIVTNNNAALFSVQPAVAANGTLTFSGAPNASGQAIVTVVLTDNGGADGGGVDASAPQTFTISVTPVNDAPSFTPGANQTVAENAGLRTVPAWATNITAGPMDESAQTLAFIVTSNNPALFSVQPSVAPDGTLTFQPASNISGQAILTVALMDNGGTGGGGLDTTAATGVTLTVLSPAPRVDLLGPASAAVGSPDVWVDLIGDGFVPQSIVKLGTTAIESEFVSRTALRALVPASALAAAGVDYLTVVNGAPGGGASSPAAFFVNDTGAPVESSDTATTDNGTATVVAGGTEPGTPGSVAAVATGTGTISIAQYDGNPSEPTGFAVSGGYFDVFVAPASTLTTVAVTTCNLNGGTSLLWHNGTDWVPVQPQTLDTTRNCITATLDATTSSPTIAQLTGTYFAVVIPTPPNVNTPGAMHGSGYIKVGTTWNRFDFWALEKVSGLERGRLRFDMRTPSTGRGKKRVPAVEHRFVSTGVTRVTFTDEPSSKPGRKAKPDVDSVVFTGAGRYDGRTGYTFEVRAVDRGEPGRQRDEFRIVIRDTAGAIVVTLDETIDRGNIQSTRLATRK